MWKLPTKIKVAYQKKIIKPYEQRFRLSLFLTFHDW
jgi:hypothetical protein